MAGDILLKEQAIVTLTSAGASLTTGSAGSAGTALDCRVGGNAVDLFSALFSLQAQCATITGIVANTLFAELYLVPAIDGTNYPDVDTTSGTSNIPFTMRAGSFVAPKAMTANTNMLFQSNVVELQPVLYTAYIINRCGQTISANWTLKVVAVGGRYT
jgi:hypothetical protein